MNNIYSQKLSLVTKDLPKNTTVVAVTKGVSVENITPLLNTQHLDFGENRLQEAQEKWCKIKQKNAQIKLHFIGKLQTNKIKDIVALFDVIHSLDSIKAAQKIAQQQNEQKKECLVFIQINSGLEPQKSGISAHELENFLKECKKISLKISGLMCIPPNNQDPTPYFQELQHLKNKFNLEHLSMGMSGDYQEALKYGATFLRIGSLIFKN